MVEWVHNFDSTSTRRIDTTKQNDEQRCSDLLRPALVTFFMVLWYSESREEVAEEVAVEPWSRTVGV
jgi:hypothetical protein